MNTIRRGTPLLLVAVAMVLVFAGSATATRLVTGKQIKDGSVRAIDLRNGSVTGGDVADGSLELEDLEEIEAPVNRLWYAERGPQGPAGAQGPAGPQGVSGLRRLTYVVSEGVPLAFGSRVDRYVACPPGTAALSGGLSSTGSAVGPTLLQSSPASDGSSWHLYVSNDGSANLTAYLWAVCATR